MRILIIKFFIINDYALLIIYKFLKNFYTKKNIIRISQIY